MKRYISLFYDDIERNLCSVMRNVVLIVGLLICLIPIKLVPVSAVKKYILIMPKVFAILIVIIGTTTLANEFVGGRYKILLTYNLNKYKIIWSKWCSNIVVCLVWGAIYNIFLRFLCYNQALDASIYMDSILTFVVYGAFVSSVGIFIVTLTQGYVLSFIVCFFLFLDTMSSVIAKIGEGFHIAWIQELLVNNIFLQVVNSFSQQKVETKMACQILFLSVVINAISSFVFAKKDVL